MQNLRQSFIAGCLLFVLSSSPVTIFAQSIDGFSPRQAETERRVEEQFRAVPQAGNAREELQRLTAEPHIAGSPEDYATAVYVRDQMRSFGLQSELREYQVDESDLSAETVALKVGLDPGSVFKTLVVRGDRHGVCLAVVPGDAELDLKALARLTGDRKVDTVPLKEVQPLTGYIRGGVTAFAGKKDYPVFVDENVQLYDVISVSAGVRGTQIVLAPDDYVKATRGTIGAISKPKE